MRARARPVHDALCSTHPSPFTTHPSRYSPLAIRSLKQSQIPQFAPQIFGHLGRTRRSTVEVARRILRLQIAPTLECTEWPRLHQHNLAVEHQPAAADPVLVDEGTHVEDALAAGDRTADHPKERSAGKQLLGALGHHPGGVHVRRLSLLATQLCGNPVLEVLHRVAADAELDQMKRHYCPTHHPARS